MGRPSLNRTEEEKKQLRRLSDKKWSDKNRKFVQKKSRIQKWKKWKIKYWGTWEELDEIYMNTISCPVCDCIMNQCNNSYQKSLDHDHFSLYFRDIICKGCNNKRGKVDRNKMFLHLELYRTTNKSN
jgi:hypothetical protein